MSKEYSPTPGDIVAVRWYDAYLFKGEKPPVRMEVISWGKVNDIEDPDYITLFQSEVQNYEEVDVDRNMWGQAIPRENIIEVKKL
jgi:hypothetical protein